MPQNEPDDLSMQTTDSVVTLFPILTKLKHRIICMIKSVSISMQIERQRTTLL